MTLIENIKIFESLVDEFAPESEFFTDDEDIRIKAKTLYAPVYLELANLKTNSKTKQLNFTYTGEDAYDEVNLPSRKVKKIIVHYLLMLQKNVLKLQIIINLLKQT